MKDELWEKYQYDGWVGPSSFKAALTEYGESVRKQAAGVCRKRAEERWDEHGITESDTNASYYPDSVENEMGIRDEESDDCAAAIEQMEIK